MNTYKEKSDKKELAINNERSIQSLIKKHKDLINKLNNAYLSKNVPGGIPDATIDNRQKEIQQFEINVILILERNKGYVFKYFILFFLNL